MCLALVPREELEEVLQLAVVLLFQEALSTSCLAGMPTELRSASHVIRLFAIDKRIPSFVDERLMEKTVHDARVHPVTFGQTRLEMARNVFDMAFASRMKC